MVTNVNLAFSFLIPDSINPWRFYTALDRQWGHAGIVRSMISLIPPNASVAGTNFLVPHLSSRTEVVALPIVQVKNSQGAIVPIDYAIADLDTVQPRHKAMRTKSRLRGTVETIDQTGLAVKIWHPGSARSRHTASAGCSFQARRFGSLGKSYGTKLPPRLREKKKVISLPISV